MTRVFLIRHGETDWNRQQLFRGREDVPLNANGVEQARVLSNAIPQQINAVYSSPLQRAHQTASIIAAPRSVDVQLNDGFVDIDYGQWQRLSQEEVKSRFLELYLMWISQPGRVVLPGGESLSEVRDRAFKSLCRIEDAHPGQTVAIVSHRVVNKVLLCAVLGLDDSQFWAIRQDTCAISSFEKDENRRVLTLLNETRHLKTLDTPHLTADF